MGDSVRWEGAGLSPLVVEVVDMDDVVGCGEAEEERELRSGAIAEVG